VKTSALTSEVRKVTEKIVSLLSSHSPPDLILNRHCAECEFQAVCRQKAIEKDDFSLLFGMTEKEKKRFNSEGIFGVTQLSYAFRPRRRPKQLAGKREKYHHSLNALAIRSTKPTNKSYAH
jgi:predicted RecB family nuclease